MPDGLACYPTIIVANLPLISPSVLRVPNGILSISTNVRGGGTIHVPTLIPWDSRVPSSRDFYPVVLYCCRRPRRPRRIRCGLSCGFRSFRRYWATTKPCYDKTMLRQNRAT